MLREEFELAVHQLRGKGFKCFGNLRMQLSPHATQEAAVTRVLHECVLEGIDRVGRHASLEHQLGGDDAGESGLQFVVGKTGNRM